MFFYKQKKSLSQEPLQASGGDPRLPQGRTPISNQLPVSNFSILLPRYLHRRRCHPLISQP